MEICAHIELKRERVDWVSGKHLPIVNISHATELQLQTVYITQIGRAGTTVCTSYLLSELLLTRFPVLGLHQPLLSNSEMGICNSHTTNICICNMFMYSYYQEYWPVYCHYLYHMHLEGNKPSTEFGWLCTRTYAICTCVVKGVNIIRSVKWVWHTSTWLYIRIDFSTKLYVWRILSYNKQLNSRGI